MSCVKRSFCNGLQRAVQIRRLTGLANSDLTPFLAEQKQGSGSGPFVEIPSIEKVPRSNVLFKLPRNTNLHGELNSVAVLDMAESPDLVQGQDKAKLKVIDQNCKTISKIFSNTNAMNLLVNTTVPTTNIRFFKIEDYKNGIQVNVKSNPGILCYTGEIRRSPVREQGKLRLSNIVGHGLLGIRSSAGPITQIALAAGEDVTIGTNSLITLDSTCQVVPETQLEPAVTSMRNIYQSISVAIKRSYRKYSNRWTEDKITIRGPGNLLIQLK